MTTAAAAAPRKTNPAARMMLLRRWHLYLGMLFGPSILFFAATGALQEFSLHEASRDGAYKPPAVLEKLSQVHIHQKYQLKPSRPQAAPRAPDGAAAVAPAPKPAETPKAPAKRPMAAKWFFMFSAVGLVLSTLLGIWVGLVQGRNKPLSLALLAAGVVLPLLAVAL